MVLKINLNYEVTSIEKVGEEFILNGRNFI